MKSSVDSTKQGLLDKLCDSLEQRFRTIGVRGRLSDEDRELIRADVDAAVKEVLDESCKCDTSKG